MCLFRALTLSKALGKSDGKPSHLASFHASVQNPKSLAPPSSAMQRHPLQGPPVAAQLRREAAGPAAVPKTGTAGFPQGKSLQLPQNRTTQTSAFRLLFLSYPQKVPSKKDTHSRQMYIMTKRRRLPGFKISGGSEGRLGISERPCFEAPVWNRYYTWLICRHAPGAIQPRSMEMRSPPDIEYGVSPGTVWPACIPSR